jgi:CheY-like chemotaxis protein
MTASKTAIKVLIIEDNPLNMELVVDLLETAGYQAIPVDNAEVGLALARDVRPDIIVMDIALPGMDGLTAIEALKRDPETSGIATIVVTAYAMKSDEERARAAGCAAYITKPIDTREFLRHLDEVLAAHGLPRAA